MRFPKGLNGPDPKPRTILVKGASLSLVLASVLSGVALVIIALRDVHVRLEVTRISDDREDTPRLIESADYSFLP